MMNKNLTLLKIHSKLQLNKVLSFIIPSDSCFGLYLLMIHRFLILKPTLISTITDENFQNKDEEVRIIIGDNQF